MTPQDDWFRASLWQDKIKSIIDSDSFAARGLFEVEKVKELYQKHINNKVQIAKEMGAYWIVV